MNDKLLYFVNLLLLNHYLVNPILGEHVHDLLFFVSHTCMRPIVVLCLVSLLIACVSCSCVDGLCEEATPARGIEALDTLYEFYNKGDLQELLKLFTDDAEVIWPSPLEAPFSGR